MALVKKIVILILLDLLWLNKEDEKLLLLGINFNFGSWARPER